MGVNGYSRSRYSESPSIVYVPDPRNPDPKKWEIEDSLEVNGFLVVKIKYPNCQNYEGMKIIVYENMTLLRLIKQKEIDPHFSNSKIYASPIARFEPTERGWRWAVGFCKEQNPIKPPYNPQMKARGF